ncbi:hypothetical protein HP439_04790 [Sphingobacterium shayense]|uniref:hypothetical protein n=1 Tax=Sphingobacterium shayense TaxID=626343 RepID=UPI0015525A78|nr:hypothetical protein [Sphingobacterium shayense]NQD70033.1 hypothetical protein [Sphingobacterium shayense]
MLIFTENFTAYPEGSLKGSPKYTQDFIDINSYSQTSGEKMNTDINKRQQK